MDQLRGHSITYRIAVGSQQGRKVFTLQTLPGIDEPFSGSAGQAAGFSLHAGVAAKANQREKVRAGTAREAALGHKLERLCRYITRPAVSEKRLSLTNQGKVRYELKTPYRDGTTHVAAPAHPAPAALVRPCTSFSSLWISLPNWPP